MIDHHHYTYRVTWSGEDREFVGTCVEFPSLSFLNENQSAAFKGIVKLVADVVADMAVNNEVFPVPLSNQLKGGTEGK